MVNSVASRTYLELVLQQILLVGELAVEAEEAGLVRGHFLRQHVRLGASQSLLPPLETTSQGARWLLKGLPMTYANVHLVLLVRIHDGGCRVCESQMTLFGGAVAGERAGECCVYSLFCSR